MLFSDKNKGHSNLVSIQKEELKRIYQQLLEYQKMIEQLKVENLQLKLQLEEKTS